MGVLALCVSGLQIHIDSCIVLTAVFALIVAIGTVPGVVAALDAIDAESAAASVLVAAAVCNRKSGGI